MKAPHQAARGGFFLCSQAPKKIIPRPTFPRPDPLNMVNLGPRASRPRRLGRFPPPRTGASRVEQPHPPPPPTPPNGNPFRETPNPQQKPYICFSRDRFPFFTRPPPKQIKRGGKKPGARPEKMTPTCGKSSLHENAVELVPPSQRWVSWEPPAGPREKYGRNSPPRKAGVRVQDLFVKITVPEIWGRRPEYGEGQFNCFFFPAGTAVWRTQHNPCGFAPGSERSRQNHTPPGKTRHFFSPRPAI